MRTMGLLVLVPALATCSTLAPLPMPEECSSDDDCNDGELCASDTLICVPGELFAPRAHLAFDIQEFEGSTLVWRTEVGGCDHIVEYNTSKGFFFERDDMQQTFELAAFVSPPSTPPLVNELLPAGSELELSQGTRFAFAIPPRRRVQYPTFEDEMMMTLAPTSTRFPRYHPFWEGDVLPPMLGEHGFVLWQVIPNTADPNIDRAPMFQMLEPPMTQDACQTDEMCCPNGNCDTGNDPNVCLQSVGECTKIGDPRFAFGVLYDELASREIEGSVVLVRSDGTSAPGSGANVQLRYADDPESNQRLGVFALSNTPVLERPQRCAGDPGAGDHDDVCIPGEQFCDDDTSQCALALAGRAANVPRSTNDAGAFTIPVYDYAAPDDRLLGFPRFFSANVSRPFGAVPATNFVFEVQMPPNDGEANWARKLCLPDWGSPVTLEISLDGDPLTFVGTGAGAFQCCDVGCLPATAEDAAMLPEPPSVTTCTGATSAGSVPSVVASAPAKLDVEDEPMWDALECVLPTRDADGNIGSLVRDVDCTVGDGVSTCVLPDLGAGDDGGPRQYALRIESPVGSVLRSVSMPLAIDATQPPQVRSIELRPRVLLRGRVRLTEDVCDPETAAQTQCGSERALVLAERVRMPGEDPQTAVGPFFHEVETFYDPVAKRPGAYVLPLDPGVYLVTALPATGSRGGPAEIRVVEIVDGEGDRELDLTLGAGVLVPLELGGNRSAFVTPLDVGSWRGDVTYPGTDTPIDLNEIGACLTPPGEGPIACKIRRLIPSANLTTSQVGLVRFTARAASQAAASCESG